MNIDFLLLTSEELHVCQLCLYLLHRIGVQHDPVVNLEGLEFLVLFSVPLDPFLLLAVKVNHKGTGGQDEPKSADIVRYWGWSGYWLSHVGR